MIPRDQFEAAATLLGAATPEDYVGSIDTPYGVQFINRGDALDHAHMRSRQLYSLLMLMNGDGAARFRSLNDNVQESLLWLARQLASDTEAMFDIVLLDSKGARHE